MEGPVVLGLAHLLSAAGLCVLYARILEVLWFGAYVKGVLGFSLLSRGNTGMGLMSRFEYVIWKTVCSFS